jgi:hypothetical protein
VSPAPDPVAIYDPKFIDWCRKKDRFQILYFPLDPPLKDNERWSRRVVTSEIVK